jgi:hypothetical protein
MTASFRPGMVGGLLTIVVAAAVAGGVFVLGSPSEERARRLDERRVQDLIGIQGAVDVYWSQHATLPPSLGELATEPYGKLRAQDPRTTEAYQYKLIDARKYELCATFERASPEGVPYGDGRWAHGNGRQCFPREPRKIP